jgi:Tfp pilus assembly protein PilO
MKPVSIKAKSVLITLVIASGAVAYSLLVFVPSQKALARLRHQLRDKQRQIVDSDRLISDIAQTEAQLKVAQDYARQWKQTAPSETRLADVYRKFAELAEVAGVEVNGIRPQSGERLKTISQYRVALDCSGPYANLFDFVHRIEESVVGLWIQQLEIDRPDPKLDLVRCKLQLIIFAENLASFTDNREKSG